MYMRIENYGQRARRPARWAELKKSVVPSRCRRRRRPGAATFDKALPVRYSYDTYARVYVCTYTYNECITILLDYSCPFYLLLLLFLVMLAPVTSCAEVAEKDAIAGEEGRRVRRELPAGRSAATRGRHCRGRTTTLVPRCGLSAWRTKFLFILFCFFFFLSSSNVSPI